MTFMLVVDVTIVQVVNVVPMLDSFMSTIWSMNVGVIFVNDMCAHQQVLWY